MKFFSPPLLFFLFHWTNTFLTAEPKILKNQFFPPLSLLFLPLVAMKMNDREKENGGERKVKKRAKRCFEVGLEKKGKERRVVGKEK